MAVAWERRFFNTRELDEITLRRQTCGPVLPAALPGMRRRVRVNAVSYSLVPVPPGTTRDKKCASAPPCRCRTCPAGAACTRTWSISWGPLDRQRYRVNRFTADPLR